MENILLQGEKQPGMQIVNTCISYSGTTKKALRWTKELLELKEIAEKITGAAFNSCF